MRRTILLIDDDYLDVESVKRALKKLSIAYDLHVAHNGEDGLAFLTGDRNVPKIVPDLILLDINMPKMNGIELLRIIKSYYSMNRIRIFILTTSAEEYDRLAAENLGIHGYITKPLNFQSRASQDTLKLLDELLKAE